MAYTNKNYVEKLMAAKEAETSGNIAAIKVRLSQES